MVNFAGSALVAILAATASAEHHGFGRRHVHQQRGYPIAPPPAAEYSTVPEVPETTSAVQTVPEASGSQSVPYPTGPQSHPQPTGSEGVPSAPYGYGNGTATAPIGTGTGIISTPDVSVSTATVIPVPETSEVATGGEQPTGGVPSGIPTGGVPTNGVPTGGLPGTTPADEGTCGPATVTVTVTQDTITVTAGKPSGGAAPPAGPSSVPEGESSEVIPPVVASSVPDVESTPVGNSYPAATPDSPMPSAPVESAPVASGSSKPSVPASHPAATPTGESPATTPVASEHESMPAYSQKPETSEAVEAPKPTSEVATAPVASSSYKAESSAVSTKKPSSSSTPVSGSKRGIIYQETSDLSAIKEQGSKCGWAWNWNSNNFGMGGDWNYVPILNTLDHASDFEESAAKAVESAPEGSKYVMGLNEPDMKKIYGGSELDASVAAENYIKYINPLGDKAKLGSISITSTEGDENAGLPYLRQWKKECDTQGGCTVDFVCIHWYGNPDQDGETQADGFIKYMKEAIDTVHELWSSDMKVWVTEFAAKPDLNVDASKHEAFIKKTVPYLDEESNVDRYAYFMASPGWMIEADGTLTSAGTTYFGSN